MFFWPSEDSIPLVENYKINSGEKVLDLGTGSGVIAVFSAYKRAGNVVALDINPDSVKCAKENSKLHGFSNLIDVRLSDLFEALSKDEKFDVITANLTFRNKTAIDLVELSQWDTNLQAHKKFFKEVKKYLKKSERIYFSQANYGAVNAMKKLPKKEGFKIKTICKRKNSGNAFEVFYAFELT